MKVYCINLKSSGARRDRMVAELSKLQCPWEFIDAVEGARLTVSEVKKAYNDWKTRFRMGKSLSRGEIGCALSHLTFCRKVLGSDDGVGFVFEDDVALTDGTYRALLDVAAYLRKAKDPVIVQLPGMDRDAVRDLPRGEIVSATNMMGAYAYGINRAAAELLIRAFSPITMPIDHYAYLAKHYGLQLYVYNEKVVTVDNMGPSTIGSSRFRVIKSPLTKAVWKCWRCIGVAIDAMIR